MFTQFLKENPYMKYLFTLLRVFLGWTWLTHGWAKISAGNFNATGFLSEALSQSSGQHPAVQSWWGFFIENVALPNVGLFNILVPWGELLVGLAILFGVFTTFATLMGLLMNFSYMFSGTTSTNPQMVLLELFILIAGFNAAKIGLDYWIRPFLKEKVFHLKSHDLSAN